MHSAAGYVDDVLYPHYFIRELAPAWLDATATLSGVEPPSRTGEFAWCELGCGQGVTATILAGTHPSGIFHGVDAMPGHIEHARRLRDDARITNLTLHALDFAAAISVELPRFDYIVAHGVHSWIDARSRDDMRRFIDRWLAPGGLVFVSYNAMPGRAADGPFQYLVREIAATCAGNSADKFRSAMDRVIAIAAAGAPALKSASLATEGWNQASTTRPIEYFVHEYLPLSWQPSYVTEVRAEMATIGLVPAGSATIVDNFDGFVLGRPARDALSKISDPNLKELSRDFFLNQRFRRDVFVREPRRLRDDERARRLAETMFDLQRPAEMVQYAMITEAGRVDFDNPAARAIVAALEAGPKYLIDIPGGKISRGELLASALALFAANEIRAVGPGTADVAQLNRALLDRLDRPEGMAYVALSTGTAADVPPAVLRATRDGLAVPAGLEHWPKFLNRYHLASQTSNGASPTKWVNL